LILIKFLEWENIYLPIVSLDAFIRMNYEKNNKCMLDRNIIFTHSKYFLFN